MKNTTPKIIAIAAVSGGGKTTITSRLGQVLRNSKTIFFDDYDFEGPVDIIDWVERGADCNEWYIDPLISDIHNFVSSKNVEFILLDYPFSRLHDKLRNIDLTIFIDTPLDIAMARRILRDYKNSNVEVILGELSNYLSRGRIGYEIMLKNIKPKSDLIIDGSLSVDEIVKIMCKEINKNGDQA
ncbi:hypothetical protein [Cohnella sp.]|uniref:hypothetical protein n=1 Tax=Cohnella sp. TaxID=1883426 RepID=UPI003562AE44